MFCMFFSDYGKTDQSLDTPSCFQWWCRMQHTVKVLCARQHLKLSLLHSKCTVASWKKLWTLCWNCTRKKISWVLVLQVNFGIQCCIFSDVNSNDQLLHFGMYCAVWHQLLHHSGIYCIVMCDINCCIKVFTAWCCVTSTAAFRYLLRCAVCNNCCVQVFTALYCVLSTAAVRKVIIFYIVRCITAGPNVSGASSGAWQLWSSHIRSSSGFVSCSLWCCTRYWTDGATSQPQTSGTVVRILCEDISGRSTRCSQGRDA